MRKSIKHLLTALCAAAILTASVGCAASAYDVAVKNGYRGNETAWLETLKGQDGKDGQDLTAQTLYETAKANGYQGTYLEFCRDVLDVEVKEDNDVDTIAQNVTSVVSIYCGFGKTTQTGTVIPGILGGFKQTTYYSSAGAGVIIDLDKEEGDALIVTNYHVIYDAECNTVNGISDSIYLYTYGAYNGFSGSTSQQYKDASGDGMKATYVGGAMNYDIAILRVDNSEFLKKSIATEANFAQSDEVAVGEKVYAIGNPSGAGIAVTEGVISVESEYITMSSTDGSAYTVDYRVMRTDAAINSGNSGGALFNVNGELIGITNAKNANSTVDNMGYALPGGQVRKLCDNLLRSEETYGDKSAHVAMLGITIAVSASEGYFDENGKLGIRETFMVYEVMQGSAASGILEAMDVIKGIRINDGEWVNFTRRYQLPDTLLMVSKGDVVKLKVVDASGNESVKTITYNKESYFTIYK